MEDVASNALPKILVVLGPTGVGKTKLSVQLAQQFNGEIVNADSMQVQISSLLAICADKHHRYIEYVYWCR